MSKENRVSAGEQTDGFTSKENKYVRKQKARAERRKAKLNPEAPPSYNKYKGYVS